MVEPIFLHCQIYEANNIAGLKGVRNMGFAQNLIEAMSYMYVCALQVSLNAEDTDSMVQRLYLIDPCNCMN